MRSTRAVLMTGLLAAALCSIALSAQVGHQAEPQIAGFQAPDTASPAVFGGDSIPDLIVSPASGTGATHVFSGAGFGLLGAGFPFNPNFAGGVRVAAGDINGDGVADVVAGQGPGGSLVTLINGATITSMGSGHPFGAGFVGGVYVASADVNGDGLADIVVGQGTGGGRLMVFSGADISLLMNVTPFGPSFTGGVTVAAGDVNGDGFADVFAGQASAGGAVALIDGATRGLIAAAPVFGPSGVSVALGDVNGDGRADAIMAPHTANGPVVVYDVLTVTPLASFVPYGSANRGVRVASADFDGDGLAEIVTGPGPGGGSTIRVISGGTFAHLVSFDAFGAGFNGGVYVAAPSLRRAATFTSPASTTFAVGQAGTFTVTTSGVPSVTTITRSGTLPAGVGFVDNGNGTATLSGTPTGPGGTFALNLTASNGVGAPATQNFVLTVNQAPAITSADSANFAEGTPNSVTVTATGFPVPTLQRTGSLPGGLTFVDNGNGTATLSGTAADGSAGPYPLTLTASNGVNPAATQNFTLTVEPDCDPVTLTPAAGALAAGTAGVAYGPVNITAAPSGTYTFTVTTGALPAGLTLSTGGVLAGTPTATGNFSFTVTAATSAGCSGSAAYTLSIAGNAQNDSFTGAVGNTQFVVGAGVPGTPHVLMGGNVLANDSGTGALTAGPAVIASSNGGQVAMAANGTFTYTPAAGFVGTDTFTYTMTDANGATDTATVTVSVGTPVWYVNAAAGAGDGRSNSPFNNMTAAASASQPGQAIYVHAGTPAGSTVLKAGQTLWGAGAAFAFGGLSIPAGTSPTLGGTVTLASNVLMGGLTVSTGGGDAIVANGLTGNATLSQVAITGGANGILINGGNATMNIGATIAGTTVRAVDIRNMTGGVVTFSAQITSAAGEGVLLDNNDGATVAFTGGIALATTAIGATTFTAINGGTVTATQDNVTIVNVLAADAGTALRVENTFIGAAGLTFARIDSGTAIVSPGVGIVLRDTGLVAGEHGGLRVEGNGANTTGGVIRRKTGIDGDFSSGVGIYLENTRNVELNWMHLSNLENSGIVGRNVHGFTMTNSLIDGVIGTTAGIQEGPIVFGLPGTTNGLVGSAHISNTQINGGIEHNVAFYNQTGTADIQFDGILVENLPEACVIMGTSGAADAVGLIVQMEGSAVGTLSMDQCRVRDNAAIGLRATASNTASLTVNLARSEFVHTSQGLEGVLLGSSGDASLTATLTDNTLDDFPGSSIRIDQGETASSLSSLRVTIQGVAQPTTAETPSFKIRPPFGATAPAIAAAFSGTAGTARNARLLIDNVLIESGGSQPGISVTTPDALSSPNTDVTITNTHVDLERGVVPPQTPGLVGIVLQSSQAGASLCANVLNNSSHLFPPPTPPIDAGIRAELVAGTFVLEGGSQPAGSDPAATLEANNSSGPAGPSFVEAIGAITVVGNGQCLLPSAP